MGDRRGEQTDCHQTLIKSISLPVWSRVWGFRASPPRVLHHRVVALCRGRTFGESITRCCSGSRINDIRLGSSPDTPTSSLVPLSPCVPDDVLLVTFFGCNVLTLLGCRHAGRSSERWWSCRRWWRYRYSRSPHARQYPYQRVRRTDPHVVTYRMTHKAAY